MWVFMQDQPAARRDVERRSFDFAVRVLRMVDALPRTIVTIELGKQVVRSATLVNSNIVQARGGVSRADFVNHMRIALKEAKETERWIRMLVAVDAVAQKQVDALLQENNEIISMLTAIVRRACV